MTAIAREVVTKNGDLDVFPAKLEWHMTRVRARCFLIACGSEIFTQQTQKKVGSKKKKTEERGSLAVK